MTIPSKPPLIDSKRSIPSTSRPEPVSNEAISSEDWSSSIKSFSLFIEIFMNSNYFRIKHKFKRIGLGRKATGAIFLLFFPFIGNTAILTQFYNLFHLQQHLLPSNSLLEEVDMQNQDCRHNKGYKPN